MRSYLTWIEINRSAFEHNINNYRAIIGPKIIFGVVIKSNAYGHGLQEIASLCQENNSIDYICVVSAQEALLLRSYGITKPILVLSIIDTDIDEIIKNNIEIIVYDEELIYEIQKVAQKLQTFVRIHVKVDTGLSRLGLLPADAITFIKKISLLDHIIIHGIATHFSKSESADIAFTRYQQEGFNNLINQLLIHNITIKVHHLACSAASSLDANLHGNMVRIGIGSYGLWPSPENKVITLQQFPRFSLKPVLTWKTKIIQLKIIPAGSFIGYDGTFQVNRMTHLAVIPIGYWDGYDRELSNKAHVLINNYVAPIVGRVAMNLTMVDVTDVPNITLHDEVILLNDHPQLSAEKLAAHCNTINYEIVTRINPLLPRIVV